MSSMKAARFYGARDVRVEDVEVPQPTATQALVAVEWCGLCGSDLHEYLHGPLAIPTQPHPLSGEKLPVIMGHEFAGRILEAPRDSSLVSGQPVMVDPRLCCSSYATCQKGLTHGCEKWGFLGLSGGGGGLSEVVAVDTARLHPLPESVGLSVAALLEPLAVAWHAIKRADITDWVRVGPVLVVGGGPVGVAVIYVLKAWAVPQIWATEPSPIRQERLRRITDVVFDPTVDDVVGECRRRSQGEGVTVVFDCAGSQQGMDSAMACLCFQGRYINIAFPGEALTLPSGIMLLREISMTSSFSYTDEDFRETVAAFVDGKLHGVESIVTSRIKLQDVVHQGFEQMVKNRDQQLKIVVSPKL